MKSSFNTPIQSISSGPRQSNMELLRILATFMVLAVHADFFSLGEPSAADFSVNPVGAIGQTVFQFLTVGAVNTFVFISGWFGIRTTLRGVAKLLFQCAFFAALIYVCTLASGWNALSGADLVNVVTAYNQWFVVSYLGLMIFAPALNALVEKTPRRTLLVIIIGFYIYQTLYSTFPGFRNPIAGGYSTISFLGLYLLVRYVRLYISEYYRGGICVYILRMRGRQLSAFHSYSIQDAWLGICS